MEIPEIQAARETPTDEIQQAKLVENAVSVEQGVRHSASTRRSSAEVEQVLRVTHMQVAERTVEKTVEIPQVTFHCELLVVQGKKMEVVATGRLVRRI